MAINQLTTITTWSEFNLVSQSIAYYLAEAKLKCTDKVFVLIVGQIIWVFSVHKSVPMSFISAEIQKSTDIVLPIIIR